MTETLTKDIKTIVRREVALQIREIFDDPDAGLSLSEKAKKRLRASRAYKGKIIPLAEIKKKYC